MDRLKWWTAPLVLGLAAAATPVAVQSWLAFADPHFAWPIALRPGETLSRDIMVRMDDPTHEVKLEYDSPKGVMGAYCHDRMAIDPEMAMPDCSAPPKLAVGLTGPDGADALDDDSPGCCQFGSGHPASAARSLARTHLTPWRRYRLQVRVTAAAQDFHALRPRIVVAPESYERDVAFNLMGLGAGVVMAVVAGGWAALAFARRRDDRSGRN